MAATRCSSSLSALSVRPKDRCVVFALARRNEAPEAAKTIVTTRGKTADTREPKPMRTEQTTKPMGASGPTGAASPRNPYAIASEILERYARGATAEEICRIGASQPDAKKAARAAMSLLHEDRLRANHPAVAADAAQLATCKDAYNVVVMAKDALEGRPHEFGSRRPAARPDAAAWTAHRQNSGGYGSAADPAADSTAGQRFRDMTDALREAAERMASSATVSTARRTSDGLDGVMNKVKTAYADLRAAKSTPPGAASPRSIAHDPDAIMASSRQTVANAQALLDRLNKGRGGT